MNKYFLIILCLLLSLSVSGQSSPDFYYTGAYRQVDFNRDAFLLRNLILCIMEWWIVIV